MIGWVRFNSDSEEVPRGKIEKNPSGSEKDLELYSLVRCLDIKISKYYLLHNGSAS